MIINSYNFMIFFPIVLVILFVIPRKWRYIWLLITSYFFYMSWNPEYAILIFISTFFTYISARIIEVAYVKDTTKNERVRKRSLIFCILLNIGILVFFKYSNFLLDSINGILILLDIHIIEHKFDIMLPVGISFYTFQALGYTIDVYRGEIKAEKNFLQYALFVSFFPQLIAGPIARASDLIKQVKLLEKINLYNYKRIKQGCEKILWGLFLKMVIADRLAIFVNEVFDNYKMYGSSLLILGAVMFAFQIYCDFNSYSTLARGCAQIIGIDLVDNFDSPYFSKSVGEFWRRWHISLSTWFRDYVYIPLGGNRCSKIKKYRNLMITFLVSGIWHGASWNFIVWGGMNGLYQIVGSECCCRKNIIIKKFKIRTNVFSYKFLQAITTFILIDFAWIFFRADGLTEAVGYIARIFTCWDPWALVDGSLYMAGLDRIEFKVLIIAGILMCIVDYIRWSRNINFFDWLSNQNLWFRWTFMIMLVNSIFIFGIYGPNYSAVQFIYFQF